MRSWAKGQWGKIVVDHKIMVEGSDDADNSTDNGIQTLIKPNAKSKTKKPSMYKVVLLNDDYTPMDFVVSILKKFFAKSDAESTNIMLQIHTQGRGVAGVYTYETAETKVYKVENFARMQEYPLKCTVEKA